MPTIGKSIVMTRRHFLQAAGIAGTALACTGTLHAAPRPGFKKSLKIGMVKVPGTLEEKFKLLKSIGYDGVELNAPNDLDLDEVLAAKKASGLEIPGVVNSAHWRDTLSHPDEATREKGYLALEQSLRDCKAYGGTTVLLVPAVVNKEVSYAQAWDRCTPLIRRALPLAKELGIKIAFENVWNNFLLSPLEAARFVDQFDSPMVGWYFDVGNVVRYGWPEQWVHILGQRIIKVDIKEYSRKKMTDEGPWAGFKVELLEGDCDWPAVMQAFDDIGYIGWGSAEVPGGDEARLRDIAERMDRIYAS